MNAHFLRLSDRLAAVLWFLCILRVTATADEQVDLPVKRVVLFNSGIGYFEHQGQVNGDQAVDLHFTVDHVNDLLKSMVLQDLSGGSISTVTYGLKNSVDQRLSEFSIDLSNAPTLGEILQQLRGERVRVEGATKGVGSIIGLEVHAETVDGKPINSEYLNLHSNEGLKSIPLRTVSRIQLLNEELDDELQEALTTLAESRRSNRRNITIRFTGEGKRDVRIAYILPTPVWKTAYRLVIDNGESALMQGWAVVENISDFDWADVSVSLVSGRPLSFAMDLYSPLFVQRQQVPVEIMGLPPSRVYDRVNPQRTLPPTQRGERAFRGGAFGGLGGGAGFGAPAPSDAGGAEQRFDPSQGVAAQGIGKEVGEFFRYDIRKPVNLPASRSAMLTIVNEHVETEKLSIYTADVAHSQPLHALRLKNTTDVFLMGGPITVFEAGNYAGDARIRDLPSGEDRLISYAVDQEIRVTREVDTPVPQIASANLKNGILRIQRDHLRTYQYAIDFTGTDQRQLMIEHPRPDPKWQIAKPKATEETESHARFVLELAPQKTAEIAIVEQWRADEDLKLAELEFTTIRSLINSSVVEDDTRSALKEYLRLRQQDNQLGLSLTSLQSQIQTIQADQSRIRSNMDGLDRTSSLYERYVAKMDEQENRLDGLVTETLRIEKQIQEVKQSLSDIGGIGE